MRKVHKGGQEIELLSSYQARLVAVQQWCHLVIPPSYQARQAEITTCETSRNWSYIKKLNDDIIIRPLEISF